MGEEIIDSRTLIEEADELEDALSIDADAGALDALGMTRQEALERRDAINELADAGIEDWQYGATMIREDKFTDYAQQLAEDIGAIDPEASWPMSYIDWEAAAEALQQDYTVVEFDGATYYVR